MTLPIPQPQQLVPVNELIKVLLWWCPSPLPRCLTFLTLWSELAGLVGVGRVCCASWVLNWCISQFGNYTATCIPTCHAPDTISHLQFLAFFSLPFLKKNNSWSLTITTSSYQVFFFFSPACPIHFFGLSRF